MNDPATATVETTAEIPATDQVKIADLEKAVNEGNKVDIAPSGAVTITEADAQPASQEFSDIADLSEANQGKPEPAPNADDGTANDPAGLSSETVPVIPIALTIPQPVVEALNAHFVSRAEFDTLNQRLQKWAAEYDALTDKLGTHGIRLDPEPAENEGSEPV